MDFHIGYRSFNRQNQRTPKDTSSIPAAKMTTASTYLLSVSFMAGRTRMRLLRAVRQVLFHDAPTSVVPCCACGLNFAELKLFAPDVSPPHCHFRRPTLIQSRWPARQGWPDEIFFPTTCLNWEPVRGFVAGTPLERPGGGF